MKLLSSILIIKVVVLVYGVEATYDESQLLDAVYWEIKPFIFRNENNEIDGIIPRMFEQAHHLCRKVVNGTDDLSGFINFQYRGESRHEFRDILHFSHYSSGKLLNVSQENAFWVPMFSYVDAKREVFIHEKKLTSFRLLQSKSIAVIVPRYMISLPNKIIKGIISCQHLFVIASVLAVFFGIFVWFLEHFRNKDFPKSFWRGSLTSLWWSMVSMTTVGYGDVVPKSVAGRFIGIIWLFVGLMIGCVMTATMTDVVSGAGNFKIYGETVSVLSDSYEEKIASKDYRAKVVPADSYDDVIELVRRGKVFAAMMNADVAAWYQESITSSDDENPLHIVKLLPANININCLISAEPNPLIKEVFKCMFRQKEEVYDSSFDYFKRYCNTETLFIGSMLDILHDSTAFQGLLAVIFVMIFLGLLSDAWNFLNGKISEQNRRLRKSIFSNGSLNGMVNTEHHVRQPVEV
jgi:Ion channel.